MRPGWIPALSLLLLLACPAVAAPPEAEAPEAPSPAAGSTDLLLGPAPRLIPWERLDEEAIVFAREVVGGALVFRHVEGIAFRSRPPVYEFLLEHMDFAAEVARLLGVGRYRVQRAAGGFQADDGRGARGLVRPLGGDDTRRVFSLEGGYDPPLLPTISGRLLLVLDAVHTRAPDGETYAEMSVAGYLRLDSALAEAIAGVARAFTEATVERKVKRFFRHVAKVSRRAYDDPEGLAEELEGHPHLPREVVAEFRRVLLAHRPPPWAEGIPFRLLPEPPAVDPGELAPAH
jgi:hypothetical protein